MGNDHSHLNGIEIGEKPLEVSNFWTQHCATVVNSGKISTLTVLIGELFIDGPLWSSQTPLEKSSRNLMIYRHPCIVKYISSWQKSSKFYLALEQVQPLNHVLNQLNTLQICIGLHSILKSLCFLHEKALVSHTNVCTASVYVTKDGGNWKLGGMEYLCRFADLTSDYLKKSRQNRYSKGVDSKEDEHLAPKQNRRDFIDIYAFGVLANDVLKGRTNDDIPCLTIFQEFCRNDLQAVDVSDRPKLSTLLQHEFFNHDFIALHSFLIELPAKTDDEKTEFFQNVVSKLRLFDEITIATQLGGLLLSRMVLLNKVAQRDVLPFVLTPRQGDNGGLFSEGTFKTYLSPKLLEIFTVRDAQIRLLLLNNFSNFMRTFTNDELQSCILPELLLGIKDTNDCLVASTLRTLADLVAILGAPAVIGGKRAKLFNDGRPIIHLGRVKHQIHERVAPVLDLAQSLPERPRPDGEEVETSTEEVEAASVGDDVDNWEDWDMNSTNVGGGDEIVNNSAITRRRTLPDITELDIKSQTGVESSMNGDDFDFFQDMEPVIEACAKFPVVEEIQCADVVSNLNLNITEEDEHGGATWGDEEWD